MMTVLSKWKIALYLLAIFCAGAVSGWVVAAKTTKEKMSAPPRFDEIANSFRNNCHSKLDLTPDQTKQIDAVIDKSSKETQSILGECSKRIRQCRNDRNAQITAVLNPEQRKQFEQMEKERQEAWRGREQPWRSKGPPHDWRRGPRDRSRTNSPNAERMPPGEFKPEK